jgi:hypothetical protein
MGGQAETIERPKQKDVAVEVVVELRRMFREAGYDSTS